MSETYTKEERQKLISRIEKLLALGQSPNENEAMAAASKAQALLAEHNLSMDDIGGYKSDVIRDNDLLTDRAGWVKPLLHMVAKLYFCGYFTEAFPADFVKRVGADKRAKRLLAGGRSRIFLRHSFIGEKHNITAAKLVGGYLINAMQRLCKEGEKDQPKEERTPYRYSFMNACAARLCFRLQQKRMEAERAGIHEGKTNLPALLSLYQKADEAVEGFLEAQKIEVKEQAQLTRINHAGGARAGIKAGNEIGLDTQIESSENGSRITKAA